MSRTRDPFPVQGRYRGVYPVAPHDPLEAELARRRAEQQRIKEAIDDGQLVGEETDLRGIPVIARGVGGTSPGTNPLAAACRSDHRLAST